MDEAETPKEKLSPSGMILVMIKNNAKVVENIATQLAVVKSDVSLRDDVTQIRDRVTIIEKSVGSLEYDAKVLKSEIATLRTDYNKL